MMICLTRRKMMYLVTIWGSCFVTVTSAFGPRTITPMTITQPLRTSTYFVRNNAKVLVANNKDDESRKLRTHQSSLCSMPRGNLDIRIDQPLLTPDLYRRSPSNLWKCFLTTFLSDAFKTAFLALFIAVGISLFTKYVSSSSTKVPLPFQSINKYYKMTLGKVKLYLERFKTQTEGVPMEFDPVVADGWGVCTLTSKTKVGRSNFIQYDFSLPKLDNVLNLALGQQLSMCCLDKKDNVAKADFYVFSDRNQLGTFSILAPDVKDTRSIQNRDTENDVGKEGSNFARVLKTDLSIGDEVAIKPGLKKLEYRGQYLPVTDMIYFASGSGIVPVLEQVKAVLPSGTSSVQSVSVIWMNASEKDFDAGMKSLEDEYFKYSTKLAVSCVVDNMQTNSLENNNEVEEAVPPFKAGTMAVVSGPIDFAEKARKFLVKKGYSKDCICVLA